VGRNKKLRARLAGLEQRVREHQEKIQIELAKAPPNQTLIAHWRKEIEGWQKQREQLAHRLPSRR
jgi:hypothetical protein